MLGVATGLQGACAEYEKGHAKSVEGMMPRWAAAMRCRAAQRLPNAAEGEMLKGKASAGTAIEAM